MRAAGRGWIGHKMSRFSLVARSPNLKSATSSSCAWRWPAFSAPQPLYGLERLAARLDAPVMVVEGEKTADAAQRHFSDHVAVTWPGGSNAYGKAGWNPLAGRRVNTWPDADQTGVNAPNEIAKLAMRAGAASVVVVPIPDDLPDGWDLADPVPDNVPIGELLDSARLPIPEIELPAGYAMTGRGLVWRDPFDDERPDLLLADQFQVLAESRDGDGKSWGVLLEWHDHDGRRHRLPLPRATLAGDGAEARRALPRASYSFPGGCSIASSSDCDEPRRLARIGVRPPGSVHRRSARRGPSSAGVGRYRACISRAGHARRMAESNCSLCRWQQQARSCFACRVCSRACREVESGGLHLRRTSSISKITALVVAGSAWGGGEPRGYVRSWRATTNGLAGVALGHCDALLCLDELAQIAARQAGEVAYMLANGSGKSRSARDGSARRAARWRLLFLSSGEIGLSDKVAEDGRGKRLSARQQVRVVDIPADPGASLGLFEELHGFSSAEALATHLRTAAASVYGTAARTFVRIFHERSHNLKVTGSNPVPATNFIYPTSRPLSLSGLLAFVASDRMPARWPCRSISRLLRPSSSTGISTILSTSLRMISVTCTCA